MKKILAILFLFPLLVLGQFEVNGSVKNSKGEPIEDAIINLDGYPQQFKTDSLGRFSIKDIPKGRYITTIFSFNYQPKTDTLNIGFDNLKKYAYQYELKAISYSANTVEIGHEDYDFGLGRIPLIDGTSIYGPKNLTLINMDHNDGNKSAGNARELFAKLPGINIWESDGGGIQVGIGTRGLSPNRTANFNTRQNGYDISADALGYPESYYSPPFEALEQIEIVKGAASLQYGTQFGGLLNFKIKRPSEKQIEFTTRNTYGAYNFFNTFNRISGTVKRFYYQAYYQYKRGDGWRENSGFHQHQAFAQVGYHITENMDISLEYTRMNYNAQQPGGLTDTQFNSNAKESFRDRNWFQVKWNLLALNYNFKTSKKGFFNVRMFGMLAQRDALGYLGKINQVDLGIHRDLIRSTFKNAGMEARFLQRYKIKKYQGAILVGARAYIGKTNTKQGFAPNGNDNDFSFLNEDNLEQSNFDFPSQNIAVFAENIFLFNKWAITPGIRYEHINSKSDGYYKNYVIHPNGDTLVNETITDGRSSSRNIFLAGLGVSYKPLKQRTALEIYGNISQNYRAINFNDIRVNNPNILIDPDISDEFGFTGEIGFRGRLKSSVIYQLSGFYIFYGNKIGLAPQGIKRIRTNLGNARNIGIEAFIEFDIMKLAKGDSTDFTLSIFNNFSYINAQYISSKEPAYVGNQVEFVPNYTLRSGIRFGYKDFNCSVKMSYVSSQFTDATNAINPSPDATIGEIPPYYVMDFSASYQFKKWFKLEGGITNFTNNIYFTRRATAYPGPGVMPSEGIGTYLTLEFKIGSKK